MASQNNDPAILFYTKDWLEGTADLSPEAKGVYIDFICYHHQRKHLPSDFKKLARLARMSLDEFKPIWEEIVCKFQTDGEKIVNKKLLSVIESRGTKSRINKLNGTFAYVLKIFNLPVEDEIILKKRFKEAKLHQTDTEWNTERLTEWCRNGVPFIEDGTENVNKN